MTVERDDGEINGSAFVQDVDDSPGTEDVDLQGRREKIVTTEDNTSDFNKMIGLEKSVLQRGTKRKTRSSSSSSSYSTSSSSSGEASIGSPEKRVLKRYE